MRAMSRKLSRSHFGLSCSARYALTALRSYVPDFDRLRDLTRSDSAFLAIVEIWRLRMDRMSRSTVTEACPCWSTWSRFGLFLLKDTCKPYTGKSNGDHLEWFLQIHAWKGLTPSQNWESFSMTVSSHAVRWRRYTAYSPESLVHLTFHFKAHLQ